MAMPINMILILYVVPSKWSCDFSKLTILYLYMYIIILYHFYDKYDFFYVNKISVCMYPTCAQIGPTIESLRVSG